MTTPRASALLVLCLCGCVYPPASIKCEVVVTVGVEVVFEPVRVGEKGLAPLSLAHPCATGDPVRMSFTTDSAVFGPPEAFDLLPGGSTEVQVSWTPDDHEPDLGTLWILDQGVALRGEPVPDADGDGYDAIDDCDETDPAVNPGAGETWYDGVDQDCDGNDDDQDGDGSPVDLDCDDTDASAAPGNEETWYDGVDQDCDGNDDDDQDGDGSPVDLDCDDLDPAVHPEAEETWYDGVDQDCDGNDGDQDGDGYDGTVDCDDDDPSVNPGAVEAWYDGLDQDCYGNDDDQDRDGWPVASDCDDVDPYLNPGAVETWYDGVDQDCDGNDDDQDRDGWPAPSDCDDSDESRHPEAEETWYDGLDQDCAEDDDYDQDGDGHRDLLGGGNDCDDTNAFVWPDAPDEWYDGVDSDCDGANDYDQDGDGFERYPEGPDCDDTDASSVAGSAEVADGLDNDCDGLTDEDSLAAGDVIITEVLVNPEAVPDSYGEWFELYNTTTRDIDLSGWMIYGDDGNRFVIDRSLVVAPGAFLALGVDEESSRNGGVTLDYEFDAVDLALDEPTDTLHLRAGSLDIFELEWDRDLVPVSGYALSLDPTAYDATMAADEESWCNASSLLPSGDAGTPGAENDLCPGVDHDGDGRSESEGDCDDLDPSVHPAATEPPGDGFDQNCNLVDESDLDVLGLPWVDGGGSSYLVSGLGDFYGDGSEDVILAGVGTNPDAYVLDGADFAAWGGPATAYDEASALSTAAVRFTTFLGADLDGDGLDDLLATGSDSAGASFVARVWPSPVFGALRDADVSVTLDVTGADGLARAADLDGDGVDEAVLLGWGGERGGGSGTGVVGVFELGSTTGAITWTDAAFTLSDLGGEGDLALSDVDGDGYVDLAATDGGDHAAVLFGDGLATSGDLDFTTDSDVLISLDEADAVDLLLVDADGSGACDLLLAGGGDVLAFLDAGSGGGSLGTSDAGIVLQSALPTVGFGLGESPIDTDADGVPEVPLLVIAVEVPGAPLNLGLLDPAAFASGTLGSYDFIYAWSVRWSGFDLVGDLDGDGDPELILGDLDSTGQNFLMDFD